MGVNPLLPLAEKCLGCEEDCLKCTEFPEMPLKGRLHLKALATEAEMCNKLYNNMQKDEKRRDRKALIAIIVMIIIVAIIFFIGGPGMTSDKFTAMFILIPLGIIVALACISVG